MATEATGDIADTARSRLATPSVHCTTPNQDRQSQASQGDRRRGSQINNGGLAVCADMELAIGNEAEIRFTPPHFYPIVRLRGVVRNRAGDRYGVEVKATSAAEKEQLTLFQPILARWDGA